MNFFAKRRIVKLQIVASSDKLCFNNSQKQEKSFREVLSGASLCFRYTKTVAIGISDFAIAFAHQTFGKGQHLLKNLPHQELSI